MSGWHCPVVFVAAIAILGGCRPDPNAPPIYRTVDDYNQALAQVEELTKTPFEEMHEGYPVSKNEKEDLRRASRLIEGLIAFKADTYGLYILKGLSLRGLDDDKGAEIAFKQGLALAPESLTADDYDALGRIHDELALLYEARNDFAQAEIHADKAVEMLKTEPSILTDAAGVKLQLKKLSDARKLIDAALKEQPQYKRALDLKKLIDMGSH